jgi:hypothetical protein
MKNNLVKQYLPPCVMAFAIMIAGSTLMTHASTKSLKVPPVSNGRSVYAAEATYSLTIPQDIVQLKSIHIKARGGTKGEHAVLVDTHVSQTFPPSTTQISQEYLEFTSRRDNQRMSLDISEASFHQSNWIPGKTKIIIFLQGDEAGLSEIQELTFSYLTSVGDEEVNPDLIEAPNLKPRGVYQGTPFRPEPFFPEDLDDERSPKALKPIAPVKNKLDQGRPENAKPERRVKLPARRRPPLKTKAFRSDRDEDNDGPRPQNPRSRKPSKWSKQ